MVGWANHTADLFGNLLNFLFPCFVYKKFVNNRPCSIYGAEFLCHQMSLSLLLCLIPSLNHSGCLAWLYINALPWHRQLLIFPQHPSCKHFQALHCFQQHVASNLSHLLVWCVGELSHGWMCLCYMFDLTSLTYGHQLSVVTLTHPCVARQQSRVWSSASRRNVAGITFWWACSWGRWPGPCSKGPR